MYAVIVSFLKTAIVQAILCKIYIYYGHKLTLHLHIYHEIIWCSEN